MYPRLRSTLNMFSVYCQVGLKCVREGGENVP